jgi:DNA-binding transcriptional MerR regulator
VEDGLFISRAAAELGVSATYLRHLEKQQRVPPARRDVYGSRRYTKFDIEFLRAMGVGSGRRLRRPEEVLGAPQ